MMISMDVAWAPVVSGVIGGVIGAAAPMVAGWLEWKRRRQDQAEACRQEQEWQREQELRASLRTLRVVHTEAVVRANDLANGVADDAGPAELGRLSQRFSDIYLQCVNAQEDLRSLCTSPSVRERVDLLIDDVRQLVDRADRPPTDIAKAMNDLSRKVREHLRGISEQVDTGLTATRIGSRRTRQTVPASAPSDERQTIPATAASAELPRS
jgi:hypothetical protein